MAIEWDTSVLPFQSLMLARKNFSRSGGLTLSGIEQVVQSSSDFWTAQATVKIRREEQRLAYRAYQAQNWGRVGEWIIPVCTGRTLLDIGGGFSSGFSSGFETATSLGVSVNIVGRVGAVADRGNNTILFTLEATGYEGEAISWQPKAGMYFSISNKLHLIGQITGPVLGFPAGTYSASFSPKLRTPALVGDLMEFTRPKCLMRLAEDNIGQMNLDMLRFADVSLSFVEVPTAAPVVSGGGGGGPGGGGGAIVTEFWNPSDKSALIELSDAGLTATLTSGFSDHAARSAHTRATGYFEIASTTGGAGIGFANASGLLDTYLGVDHNSVMYAPSGNIIFADDIWGTGAAYTAADIVGGEVTTTAIKFYKNGTLQFTMDRTIPNSSPLGGLYAAIDLGTSGNSGTANFGGTPMAHLPSGITSWDGSRTG